MSFAGYVLLLVGGFLLLMVLGVPIAFSLSISAIFTVLVTGQFTVTAIFHRMIGNASGYTLLAIPFFILAAKLMNTGGITKRIIDFCMEILRPFHGGLGEVNIVASMIFGGISGSSVADTSALGCILIPAMEEKGYPKHVSAGITVASSTMGMIIPPSTPMVVYAMVSGASIGALFMAGAVPGILLGHAPLHRHRPEHLPAALREQAFMQHVENGPADVVQLFRKQTVVVVDDLGEGDGVLPEEDVVEDVRKFEGIAAEHIPGMPQDFFRRGHLRHIRGERPAVLFQVAHGGHRDQDIGVGKVEIHRGAVHPRQIGDLPDRDLPDPFRIDDLPGGVDKRNHDLAAFFFGVFHSAHAETPSVSACRCIKLASFLQEQCGLCLDRLQGAAL